MEVFMGVFISFAEEDQKFAQILGASLTKKKVHVFVDRWHISIGDNLRKELEREIKEADFICCILSKSSSDIINKEDENRWFYEEYQLTLKRESAENRTILLPIVIEPCEIPFELQDRLFANFVDKDFDITFNELMIPLAKLLNNKGSRFESDHNFYTDFGMDYSLNRKSGLLEVSLDFIEYSRNFNWSVLTHISIEANKAATRYFQKRSLETHPDRFIYTVIAICEERFSQSSELSLTVNNDKPQTVDIIIDDPKLKFRFNVKVKTKKLGEDLGFDHLIHCGDYFKKIIDNARPSKFW